MSGRSRNPAKRRLYLFRALFQYHQHWRALMEDRAMADTLALPSGEQVNYYDLLEGLHVLSPRQMQAFTLLCLWSFTEPEARDVMMPGSREQVVGEYARIAMDKMLDYYDHGSRV